MKRRQFLQNIATASAGTIILSGIPVKVLAGKFGMIGGALASANDKVLVFIQLHGGNDGLNTLIPVDQYNEYYALRPNIAIPDQGARKFINVDTTIPIADQVGLHPDMKDFKLLYDAGKAVIIKNVGYPEMNGSHFRGRDLVFMGMDETQDTLNVNSGWMGRFLNEIYPNYPDNYPTTDMPDPVAIEIGAAMSIAFDRGNGIPMGLNVDSPQAFYDLINGVGVDNSQLYTPDGFAGVELDYLRQFELLSNDYAARLKDVYNAGRNSSVVYPETYPLPAPGMYYKNELSGQLKLIARLLRGGIKTRIFLCRIGGFDTHASQVLSSDEPTIGTHAALLYHLSSAVKAFQDDLALLDQEDSLQLEDKVLSMTFTEFGRRAESNLSLGTDHGTSTPVFIFGKALESKIMGTNPDLSDLEGGDIKWTKGSDIDYRQIYATVVDQWFQGSLEAAGFKDYDQLNLFGNTGINNKTYKELGLTCFPNPVEEIVNVQFWLPKDENITISVINLNGQTIYKYEAGEMTYGKHQIPVNLSKLSRGNYILQLSNGKVLGTQKLIKK